MADSQVKTANICNITSSTLLKPNAGGSGTYIADNSISVHMTNQHRASGIYISSLPEQSVIGDKYTISFVPVCATNNVMLVVLYGATTQISFTSGNRYTLTITATAADNTVAFYGGDTVEKTVIIKDIQIEKGETATPYRPYSATGWLHSLRKLTTSTDTITTLPVDIYADGTNATVGISGNMEQNGAPTPQNPIQPSECGDLETVGEKAGQYKIPISSASTTTPVYLGEVESTRIISKYEFTGEENIRRTSAGYFYAQNAFTNYNSSLYEVVTTVFSHYKAVANMGNGNLLLNNEACLYSYYQNPAQYKEVYINDTRFTTADDFKAYLSAQYAAGTPVTVWYVLANETTGIVNEPLRKIGDYADEVSGISIPTIAGANSFDVLTTLKPSEVMVNYKGWHPVTDVHEYDSNYTIATIQALTIAQLQSHTISDLEEGEWA